MEIAVEVWQVLFYLNKESSISNNSDGESWRWKTGGTDWLGLWIEYLNHAGEKGVSKDLWKMIYKFRQGILEKGDDLEWFGVGQFWPNVIDNFVIWVREKRAGDGKMEVE
jgi:hypothetical protein